MSNGTNRVLLLIVLLIAFSLRVYGIGWDSGFYAHPDERHIIDVTVNRVHLTLDLGKLLDADSSPLNPRRLENGVRLSYSYGTLLIYFLKAVSNLVAKVLGQQYAEFESIYVVARSISAIADTLTVLFIYLLALRLFGARTGIIAALLSAFSVIQIQFAHFYVAEPIMTLLLVISLWFAVSAIQDHKNYKFALSGLFLGFAIATKPSAAAFCPALLLLLAIRSLESRISGIFSSGESIASTLMLVARRLTYVLPATVLAWAIWEPYALLDFPTYAQNIVAESQIQRGIIDVPYTRQYIGTIPGWYHLTQYARWEVGIPLGIAVIFGLFWALFRTLRSGDSKYAVLLIWILPYTASILLLEAKWLRYMLPIHPVLLILASAVLSNYLLHSRFVTRISPEPGIFIALKRLIPYLAIFSVIVGTLLWALAFERIYTRPHVWVTASEWIYKHIPPGSTIGTEHWDDRLPLPVEGNSPSIYNYYTIAMYDDLPPDEKLQQIEDVLRNSDYIVLATNRLYKSIPMSPWRYAVATRYYQLLFSERLGFIKVAEFHSSPSLGAVPIDESSADDNVAVYDHPPVVIFKKERQLADWELRALFADSLLAPWNPSRHGKVDKPLMINPLTTLSSIGLPYYRGIINNSLISPIAWFFILELIGLLGWILLAQFAYAAQDSGWMLSKLLSIVIIALGAWLGTSLGLLTYPASLWVITIGFILFSLSFALVNSRSLVNILRSRIRRIVLLEGLFLLLFIVGLLMRIANPDLWHPIFGGEKPMELSFINAIQRSSNLPPYDPWFSGGYINYYYFGQWLAAVLMRLTFVGPAYGFNIAVAWIFAVTGTLAFTFGYEISKRFFGETFAQIVGFLSTLLMVVVGNLDGLVQLVQSFASGNLSNFLGNFDFWRSTRITGGNIIHEFPFFTFLYADLHAHMVAMPMALGLLILAAYYVFISARKSRLIVIILASMLGSVLIMTNPWDFPTYSGLFLLAVSIRALTSCTTLLTKLLRVAHDSLTFIILSVAFCVPFFVHFKSFYSSFGLVHESVPVTLILIQLGLFFAIVLSYALVTLLRDTHLRFTLLVALGAVIVGLSLNRLSLGLLLALFICSISCLWQSRNKQPLAIWLGLTSVGLAIWVLIEIFYLRDFLDGSTAYRMNTIFKFGLQSWILLALGCAGLLPVTYRSITKSSLRVSYLGVCLFLITSSLIYTVAGSYSRLSQRFPVPPSNAGLNGEAFLTTATLTNVSGQTLSFKYDYDAIQWLRKNIAKPDVLVEASIGPYRGFGSRISMFTGLPDVMGWDNHESQQRYPDQVFSRSRDVRNLYDTSSIKTALELILRYDIKYIYLGPVERLHEFDTGERYASQQGLEKFDRMVGPYLKLIYSNSAVKIYEVKPSWQWSEESLSKLEQ